MKIYVHDSRPCMFAMLHYGSPHQDAKISPLGRHLFPQPYVSWQEIEFSCQETLERYIYAKDERYVKGPHVKHHVIHCYISTCYPPPCPCGTSGV
eukprot:5264420-Karenia_brevis.AAC.1